MLFLGFAIGYVACCISVMIGIAIVSIGAPEKPEEIQK